MDLVGQILSRVVVVHAFSPSTLEADTRDALNMRPAWFPEEVPEQTGLYGEILS